MLLLTEGEGGRILVYGNNYLWGTGDGSRHAFSDMPVLIYFPPFLNTHVRICFILSMLLCLS